VLAAVGVKLTGVDNSTYSLTGENYSAIIGPNTESNTARVLQKDDVALGKHGWELTDGPSPIEMS
jgi:hypothetical protein